MSESNRRRSLRSAKTDSTLRIDVTEHLTHVRTVHFALLALCFILLAALLLNRDTEVTRAVAQLTTVNNGLQRWNPTWLQNHLLQTNAAQTTSETGATHGPWFLQGSETRPAISVERPTSERTLWPLPEALADLATPWRGSFADLPWDLAPELQKKPKTLAEFKTLWNVLDTTIAVHQIESVSDQASVFALRQVEGSRREVPDPPAIVPLTRVPIYRAACRIAPRLTYLPREGMPEAIAAKSKAPFIHLLHGYCPDSVGTRWSASIEVTVKDAQTFNGQSTFLEAHGITAPLGPYERAFSDLARVTANYDDLDFKKLFAVLSAEATRAGDRIELFGAKLPGGGIALWGLPLLCILQLYLLLHLETLRGSVRTAPTEGFVSWIGLYQSTSAHATTIASACLLPFLTGLLLRYIDAPPSKWVSSRLAWGLTASLAVSFVLAALTWRAVWRVWDAAACSTESPQVRVPSVS